MSAPDTFAIIQTLIALITAILLLVYILATKRLQRQAHEQNRLQREQLEIAKQELAQTQLRERRLLLPYFRWLGGSSSQDEENWEFENLGADICNVRWTARTGISLDYEPRHLIRSFDRGTIKLRPKEKPIIYPVQLSLTFTNRFGDTCTGDFLIAGPGNQPKPIGPDDAKSAHVATAVAREAGASEEAMAE